MIRYTRGNLLEAKVDAVVNTVNTVGVMGKGIALMFKEAFPDNFKLYEAACKNQEVEVGRVLLFENDKLFGPKWIINFPTKKHWRHPTKLEWIVDGLDDLCNVVISKGIKSIAVPPLGCGNGGLDWDVVKPVIYKRLSVLENVEVIIYEPTVKYQNVEKKTGVDKLTPARALVAELIRQYWTMGIECTILEVQKLAWFLERNIERLAVDNPLDLRFEANKFGPYATRLSHLLDSLDGSYLHCRKRIADAGPFEVISFDNSKTEHLQTYLKSSEVKFYTEALEATLRNIDGFESPFGMELLATVDWLIYKERCLAITSDIKNGLANWPGGVEAAKRKMKIFNDDRLITLALEQLSEIYT